MGACLSAVVPYKDPTVAAWLSPTQVDLVELCERKFFFDRVLKMRAPASPWQQFGIDTENHIERALVDGIDPPKDAPGAVASKMLEFLPPRGTPGLVFQSEFHRKVEIVPGNPAKGFFGFLGKKDLRLPGKQVIDFKTTKDPKKYMKSAPQLLADIQCTSYAWDEMLEFGLQSMPMDWVYGKTKGAPRAYHSPVTVPWAKVEGVPERIRRAGLRVLDLKEPGRKVEDTKFNTSACEAFGGCSHRQYCPARAKNLSQLFGFEPTEEKKMGIKDKLLASLGASPAAAAAPAAPATPPPAPTQAAVVAAAQASVEKIAAPAAALGANGKPILVFGDAACGACQGTAWNFKGGPCAACKATGYEGGVEPEDPLEAPPAAVPSQLAEGVNPPDALLSPDDQPKAETPAAAPARRTRRTKAQIEADAKAQQATAGLAQSAGQILETGETVAEALAITRQSPEGFRLFVDCLPIKGSATLSADGLVQSAIKLAAEKAGVLDYRLVEYGKGPAYVVMALAELTNGGQLFGDYTISSRLPENQAVLGWLMDRAQSVVKGV